MSEKIDQNLPNQVFIKREDVALVIIDIQEKLLPVMSEKEILTNNAIRLVKFANILQIPIILTEQTNLGPTVTPIREELISTEPIAKLSFNCFGVPKFSHELQRLKRTVLVVAGIEAHICVTQTVLHALQNHYEVHVISDAISARFIHNKDIAAQRMRTAGAMMSSTEMFIYEILGSADNPAFKQTLKLVK